MSFYEMRFALPIAARAAGLKPDTLHKWIARGDLVMRRDDSQEGGHGVTKYLSARTTLQLILSAELARRGLKTGDACEAAINFAHDGEIEGQLHAKHTRKSGHLFPGTADKVLTMFVIDRNNPTRSKVRRVEASAPIGKNRPLFDAIDLEVLFTPALKALEVDVTDAIAAMKG